MTQIALNALDRFASWSVKETSKVKAKAPEAPGKKRLTMPVLVRHVAKRSGQRVDADKVATALQSCISDGELDLSNLSREDAPAVKACLKKFTKKDWHRLQKVAAGNGGRGIAHIEIDSDLLACAKDGLLGLNRLESISVWVPPDGGPIDFGMLKGAKGPLRIKILGTPSEPLTITVLKGAIVDGDAAFNEAIRKSVVLTRNADGSVNKQSTPLVLAAPPQAPAKAIDETPFERTLRILGEHLGAMAKRSQLTPDEFNVKAMKSALSACFAAPELNLRRLQSDELIQLETLLSKISPEEFCALQQALGSYCIEFDAEMLPSLLPHLEAFEPHWVKIWADDGTDIQLGKLQELSDKGELQLTIIRESANAKSFVPKEDLAFDALDAGRQEVVVKKLKERQLPEDVAKAIASSAGFNARGAFGFDLTILTQQAHVIAAPAMQSIQDIQEEQSARLRQLQDAEWVRLNPAQAKSDLELVQKALARALEALMTVQLVYGHGPAATQAVQHVTAIHAGMTKALMLHLRAREMTSLQDVHLAQFRKLTSIKDLQQVRTQILAALQIAAGSISEDAAWLHLPDNFTMSAKVVSALNELDALSELGIASPSEGSLIGLAKLQGGKAKLQELEIRPRPGEPFNVAIPRFVDVRLAQGADLNDEAIAQSKVYFVDSAGKQTGELPLLDAHNATAAGEEAWRKAPLRSATPTGQATPHTDV